MAYKSHAVTELNLSFMPRKHNNPTDPTLLSTEDKLSL